MSYRIYKPAGVGGVTPTLGYGKDDPRMFEHPFKKLTGITDLELSAPTQEDRRTLMEARFNKDEVFSPEQIKHLKFQAHLADTGRYDDDKFKA